MEGREEEEKKGEEGAESGPEVCQCRTTCTCAPASRLKIIKIRNRYILNLIIRLLKKKIM